MVEINKRFPILSGFDLWRSANRLSQSRGHFSARPPNSSMSFRARLRDVHAISSCSRLRPGLEIITSPPCERACKLFSRALSQRGSAIFRHRYIASEGTSHARFITDLCAVVGLHVPLRFKQRLERVTSLERAMFSFGKVSGPSFCSRVMCGTVGVLKRYYVT